MKSKFAGCIGNHHAWTRVTPFFDTPKECQPFCEAHGYGGVNLVVMEFGNWQEHINLGWGDKELEEFIAAHAHRVPRGN